jgi:hypothetical protein
MIIHHQDDILIEIYRCPICREIYRKRYKFPYHAFISRACFAIHMPGTCCHCGERKISNKEYNKILKILQE